MDTTNADRQRRWRERRRQDHVARLDKLAVLEARVAHLEAELTARPQPAPRKAARRDAVAAPKRERDELAERLAQIEAYQPGIAAKARAWVAEIDKPPPRRRNSKKAGVTGP